MASFCPLILNVFAVDIWRFFALTQISAFLVLIAVGEQFRITLLPKPWLCFAGYILMGLAVIGAATAIPLFDGYEVNKPPYLPYLFHLYSVFKGDSPWMQIPDQF